MAACSRKVGDEARELECVFRIGGRLSPFSEKSK